MENELNTCIELLQIGIDEHNEEVLNEIAKDIITLDKNSVKQEINCLFIGKNDDNNCFLEINAGAGGTESNDWAAMLLRMYLRWCEKKHFQYEIMDQVTGEEAGIKSVTVKITGEKAYGWSKMETGVHRLVRISPFDANSKRHTSFASVWIYPLIEENIDIKISPDDIRIDTYRASGAGGQHVNKTESAVRITHVPTNLSAQSQSDRSQHKNKERCLKMLKAKLYALEMKNKQTEKDIANSNKSDIAWGNHIRSYVLHPYHMVKDLRTGLDTPNTAAVLNGEIDNFIITALSKKLHHK
ncbi:Peptide chain release factor 2 [Candidatus Xenohaliotis californiensis]|uniref:Peptide chain release factor 2 n=1 Tax=Candidatus Xenohaliotis californiensis TaxID=84677 RepID=A0ABP0EWH1_9RICK|nr:Peptide chain release factor 2 [Candidatus Xenohaliotis californiensis]